jgi:hypothetical protein
VPNEIVHPDRRIERAGLVTAGGARLAVWWSGGRVSGGLGDWLRVTARLMRGDANIRYPRPGRVEIADKIIRNRVQGKGVLYLSPLESLCGAADCPIGSFYTDSHGNVSFRKRKCPAVGRAVNLSCVAFGRYRLKKRGSE